MLDFPAVTVIGLSTLSISQYLIKLVKLLPPFPLFYIIRLSSIVHIHIYVNESRHSIYMNVGNAIKSYNMKRRKYKKY
jgi:hypothetical protein